VCSGFISPFHGIPTQTVYQVILVFGYYTYIQEQRKQKRLKNVKEEPAASDNMDNMPGGPLVLNIMRKSTLLVLSRGIALGFASMGGAVGSMISPGWGTLVGNNFGDGLASTLTEEFVGDG
jgi:hypothetical protein